MLDALAERQVNEVLLESGSSLAGAFIQVGLVDELIIYMAPHLMGDNARGLVQLPGLDNMSDRIALQVTEMRAVGHDWRITATINSNN